MTDLSLALSPLTPADMPHVDKLDERAFGLAVDLLADTQAVWIAGSRRSFPVAVYLDYALQHTDKRIGLVTALGSMHEGQMRSVRPGDEMIAISYAPYAEETMQVAQQAVERGARLIAITDSRMSPLAREAATTLLVQDSATFGFRSLTATMGSPAMPSVNICRVGR